MSKRKWQCDDSVDVVPIKSATSEEYCIVCGRTLGDHGVMNGGKRDGEVVCPAEIDDD